jgi:cytochrome c peroxidase
MRPVVLFVTGVLVSLAIVLAIEWPYPRAAESVLGRYKSSFQPLPQSPPIPPDNPMTAEKIELGKMLYFDRRLSKTGATSCAYCHDLAYYGAEPVAKSLGIEGKVHLRHSPTVLNAGFLRGQFWDGRDPDLETQALSAIKSPVAMGEDPTRAAQRLNAIPEYRDRFRKVFGSDATAQAIGQAIAAFERTLNTPDYPLARYLKGDDNALSPEQKKGMQLFVDKGCIACHGGPNFSRGTLARILVPGAADDFGLMRTTKKEDDKHLFRVPTLLNVAMTAPYTHAGSIKTLDEMVRFMGREAARTSLTDDEVKQIVAFLHGLTGRLPDIGPPPVLPVAPHE